jgi:hypothetical protein
MTMTAQQVRYGRVIMAQMLHGNTPMNKSYLAKQDEHGDYYYFLTDGCCKSDWYSLPKDRIPTITWDD